MYSETLAAPRCLGKWEILVPSLCSGKASRCATDPASREAASCVDWEDLMSFSFYLEGWRVLFRGLQKECKALHSLLANEHRYPGSYAPALLPFFLFSWFPFLYYQGNFQRNKTEQTLWLTADRRKRHRLSCQDEFCQLQESGLTPPVIKLKMS